MFSGTSIGFLCKITFWHIPAPTSVQVSPRNDSLCILSPSGIWVSVVDLEICFDIRRHMKSHVQKRLSIRKDIGATKPRAWWFTSIQREHWASIGNRNRNLNDSLCTLSLENPRLKKTCNILWFNHIKLIWYDSNELSWIIIIRKLSYQYDIGYQTVQ